MEINKREVLHRLHEKRLYKKTSYKAELKKITERDRLFWGSYLKKEEN